MFDEVLEAFRVAKNRRQKHLTKIQINLFSKYIQETSYNKPIPYVLTPKGQLTRHLMGGRTSA